MAVGYLGYGLAAVVAGFAVWANLPSSFILPSEKAQLEQIRDAKLKNFNSGQFISVSRGLSETMETGCFPRFFHRNAWIQTVYYYRNPLTDRFRVNQIFPETINFGTAAESVSPGKSDFSHRIGLVLRISYSTQNVIAKLEFKSSLIPIPWICCIRRSRLTIFYPNIGPNFLPYLHLNYSTISPISKHKFRRYPDLAVFDQRSQVDLAPRIQFHLKSNLITHVLKFVDTDISSSVIDGALIFWGGMGGLCSNRSYTRLLQ